MASFTKCLTLKTTTSITLPNDWSNINNFAWVFGAGGNGDASSYACVGGGGHIHVPYAGSGGGGGAYTSGNIGGSPGDIVVCTVAVAGGRLYYGSPTANQTIIASTIVLTARSGENASTSGPCINDGGIQGQGATLNNEGGFGNSGFGTDDGADGGNLWNGRGQNSANWTSASAITPNVWFDPTGGPLDSDTVTSLFDGVSTPIYGGGGQRGLVAGNINGQPGFFPGGAGGGGAIISGSTFGTGGAAAPGFIILYYTPSITPPPSSGNLTSVRWF